MKKIAAICICIITVLSLSGCTAAPGGSGSPIAGGADMPSGNADVNTEETQDAVSKDAGTIDGSGESAGKFNGNNEGADKPDGSSASADKPDGADIDNGVKDIEVPVSSDEGEFSDVTMSVAEGKYDSQTAAFVLKNNSDMEYTYGADYALERYRENNWHEIRLDDPLAWNSVAYRLAPNSSSEFEVDWSYGYGELESGRYRLRKSFCDPAGISSTIYAEFEIK